MEKAFREYVLLLTNVSAFKYLGHILTTTDNYWTVVVANLRNSRKKWVRISRILGWEGGNTWTSGEFFKVFIH